MDNSVPQPNYIYTFNILRLKITWRVPERLVNLRPRVRGVRGAGVSLPLVGGVVDAVTADEAVLEIARHADFRICERQ